MIQGASVSRDDGVFIVGGEGFVGSHVTRLLLASGHRVCTFGPPMAMDLLADLNRSGSPGLLRVRGSAEDPAGLLEALRRSGAQTVVWAAGFNADATGLMASGESDAARAIAINVGAWANTLRAAAQTGIRRIVACGSSVVYGAAADYAGPVTEEAAHLPRSLYGLTKSLAESTAHHFTRIAGLEIVTLRLPLLFGPGRWYAGAAAALSRLIEAARESCEITLTLAPEPVDLMYAKDAARAVTAALQAPHCAPVYNVNGFTTRPQQIIDTLKYLRPGFNPTITFVPAPWTYPLMDCTRIEQDLGFRPGYSLEAALRDHLNET